MQNIIFLFIFKVKTDWYLIKACSNIVNGYSELCNKIVHPKAGMVRITLYACSVGPVHTALFGYAIYGITATLVLPMCSQRLGVTRSVDGNTGVRF